MKYPWQMVGGYPIDLFLTFNGKWFAPHGGLNGAEYREIDTPRFASRYVKLRPTYLDETPPVT